ncbi:ABC transporter permease [Acidiferrimicrobium sp. IK]|uniref:MlaE family ABC transporter permease n=1 Tax=Acidiferrimicrobium sp. IK TaxID=2871700 RepID=UPI0021CB75B6|nr:ABC transporter permease [Acidiferrimicrobium sp. IK]MCU4184188.1 ABC transporter permease [Acidiferrimicrobium sp. IK]
MDRAEDASVGAYLLGLLDSFGTISSLVLDSLVVTVTSVIRGRFAWREFLDQCWMLISVSFLPTIFIAVPFGAVIVLEVGGLASQVGATSFTGAVDALTTVREVAPIVTALILSGAGGSAICADLGSRTIRDEISAMEVMGVSPVERLVAPRLLAGVIVAVLLNGIVAFAGLLAAYAADVYILKGTSGGYLEAFSSFAQGADVIESTLKAFLFGFVACVLACFKGLNARRGPVGVGLAVNQSVVVTGLALFTLDLVLTQIFLVIVPLKVP